MYRKMNKGWLKHGDFEILDLIFLELTFYIAYAIRHKEYFPTDQPMYIRLSIMLLVFDIVVVLFSHNYKGILQRNFVKEVIAVIQHVTIVELLLLLYEFVIREAFLFSRAVFLLSWGLGIIACFIVRVAWKQIVRNSVSNAKKQSNMLLISTEDRVETCLQRILTKEFREFKVSGIAIPDAEEINKQFTLNAPVICGRKNLLEYIRNDVVDEVYVDTFQDKESLNKWINLFLSMGVTVHIGMGFLPKSLPNQFMEKIGDEHVITTTIKTASGWQLTLKRFVDIIGAIVGLILTGVAYVFVAPAIKKVSPGPVFFKQERVGKNGRTFYMYKFRSMYMDAEERKKELMSQNQMNGLMFKMENDPRIIGSEKGSGKGLGNFIRKTSIDELPQFWNILKGDMSLVGTRPPTLNEFKEYDLHHKIRLSMKPGLTGMWQVSGRSDITDFDEVVQLDTKYIENWSLGLDVKILFKTIKVVFDKEGSK